MTGVSPRPDVALSKLKHYMTLANGAIGIMLDTGLVVVGTLWTGLGIATLLGGFGVFGSVDLSTGAFLASALILIVVGLFALGIASEGPLGRGKKLAGYNIWEVGIGRAIAGFLVGFGFLLLQGFLVGFLEDLPAAILRGADGLHAAAVAGMVAVPSVGVPMSMLFRGLAAENEWAGRLEFPSIFLAWAIATMIGM